MRRIWSKKPLKQILYSQTLIEAVPAYIELQKHDEVLICDFAGDYIKKMHVVEINKHRIQDTTKHHAFLDCSCSLEVYQQILMLRNKTNNKECTIQIVLLTEKQNIKELNNAELT